MFCPLSKEECRTDCVRWNSQTGKCNDVITAEAYVAGAKFTEAYTHYLQFMQLNWRIEMKRLLNDPTVPNDIKEALQETTDAIKLGKLLEDAGLI